MKMFNKGDVFAWHLYPGQKTLPGFQPSTYKWMGVGIDRRPTYDCKISSVPGKPGVMVHTFKSSTGGAEAGGFCEFLKMGLRKAKAASL